MATEKTIFQIAYAPIEHFKRQVLPLEESYTTCLEEGRYAEKKRSLPKPTLVFPVDSGRREKEVGQTVGRKGCIFPECDL